MSEPCSIPTLPHPILLEFSSVQLLSHVWLFVTPGTIALQASLSITNSQSLLRLMSIKLVMPSNHLISSSVGLFFSHLQSFPASGSFPRSQFFTLGSQSIGLSASASVLAMTIQDWFLLGWTWLDPLAVQGTLKSLLQHHSSKASILQCSAFFIVQLSHQYMTTGKTIALTRWIFVGKVMSLLFNMQYLYHFPILNTNPSYQLLENIKNIKNFSNLIP